MTRLQVFLWTVLACIASMTSICLAAAAVFMSSAFASLLLNAWFLAFFSGFLVLYLGGGVGILLGLVSLLEKKPERDSWGKTARSVALYANPPGIIVFAIRFVLRIPARPAA